MVELLFESFGVHATTSVVEPLASLYAAGRGSGLVVDVGESMTQVCPVFEGYVIPRGVRTLALAGQDVTELLQRRLDDSAALSLSSGADLAVLRDIKRRCCFVARDGCDAEFKRLETNTQDHKSLLDEGVQPPEQSYTLPDGSVIAFDCRNSPSHLSASAAFEVGECLFQPSRFLGRDLPGLPEFVAGAVRQCDVDVRSDLAGSVVLAGGCSLLRGLHARVSSELAALFPRALRTRVLAPPERRYTTWIGLAIIAQLGTFRQQWMLRAEYEEQGADRLRSNMAVGRSARCC